MKKPVSVLPALIILGTIGWAAPAAAQQAHTVAVFDFQKTIQTSVQGKAVLTQLKAKEDSITQRLGEIDNQILSLETKLKTQNLTLTEEAKRELSLDIDRLVTSRKRYQEDSTREYQQLQFQLFNRTRDAVLSVVKALALEKEFSLVLDVNSGGVAFYDAQLDVTEEVIKRYDASAFSKK
jgi:Skp family chaperone for outer membrane proteins